MEEAIAIVKKYRDNILGSSMGEQIERAVLNSIIEDLEAAQHRVQLTGGSIAKKPNCGDRDCLECNPPATNA